MQENPMIFIVTSKQVFTQGRIQGVSCISIDTANVLSKKREKKINIYYYYSDIKGKEWLKTISIILD